MNTIDIFILVIFGISALMGILRGFTKEILSLCSWGGAVGLSYVFLPLGRSITSPYIANTMMADGVAFFGLFIVSLIILSILVNVMSGYIHESSFKGIDYSLGFGFGIFRGVVIVSAAELIFSTFSPRKTQSETFQTARFIPMARKGGDTLLQILPNSAREWVLEQATKVENQVGVAAKEHVMQKITQFPVPSGEHQVVPLEENSVRSDVVPQNSSSNVPSSPINNPLSGGHQNLSPGSTMSSSAHLPPQPSITVNSQPQTYGGTNITKAGQPRQDIQKTVDELSRLKPQSIQKEENKGYTRGQRDDMDRLFQSVEGG